MRIRMLIPMRTTLVLDDRVLRDARRRALDAGQTLSAYVTDALRLAAAARNERPAGGAFRIVTFGDAGSPRPVTPAQMKAALDEDDAGKIHRRGR